MVANDKNISLLVQVAKLYYEDNLSQQQIAEKMGKSRSLIALYLKRAKERGIIRFEIVDPQNNCENLAFQIKEKFGITHACVVPTSHNIQELNRRAIGNAVSQYLDMKLKDGDILGLGWGRTIMEAVDLFAPAKPRQIDVVPIMGESFHTNSYTRMNEIVLRTAEAFMGKPYFLLAPLILNSKELHDDLMNDSVVNDVISRWKNLSIACVGIGNIAPIDGKFWYIGEKNIIGLKKKGAVGDICIRYFDRKGNIIDTGFNRRLICINFDDLKNSNSVIAMASGVEKTEAVLGALNSKIITDLFIDEKLAYQILQEDL